MKKCDKIFISRVENGFEVLIRYRDTLNPDLRFVYNLTGDLIADIANFLAYEDEE